jgi:hypothetical protein
LRPIRNGARGLDVFGTALDLTIGLVLIYFLFSLVTSGINEVIASACHLRAKYLEAAIVKLLGEHAAQFFAHPSIMAMGGNSGWALPWKPLPTEPSGGRRKPSYIPSDTFATTVLSIVAAPAGLDDPTTAYVPTLNELQDNLESALRAIPNQELGKTLQLLYTEAGNDLAHFMKGIENWFDSSMDRVSGWYKRNAKITMMAIGLVVAVAGNIDTLSVAKVLWNNGPVRDAVVAQAQNVIANSSGTTTSTSTDSTRASCPTPLTSSSDPAATPPPGDSVACVVQQIDAIQQLHLPIGWSEQAGVSRFSGSIWNRALKILGWVLTAIALSFGAPFWFQMLGKLVNLRSSGPPPAPSGGAPTIVVTPGASPSAPPTERQARKEAQDVHFFGAGADNDPEPMSAGDATAGSDE